MQGMEVKNVRNRRKRRFDRSKYFNKRQCKNNFPNCNSTWILSWHHGTTLPLWVERAVWVGEGGRITQKVEFAFCIGIL